MLKVKLRGRHEADHGRTKERTALKLNNSALTGSLNTENNSLSAPQIRWGFVCSCWFCEEMQFDHGLTHIRRPVNGSSVFLIESVDVRPSGQ